MIVLVFWKIIWHISRCSYKPGGLSKRWSYKAVPLYFEIFIHLLFVHSIQTSVVTFRLNIAQFSFFSTWIYVRFIFYSPEGAVIKKTAAERSVTTQAVTELMKASQLPYAIYGLEQVPCFCNISLSCEIFNVNSWTTFKLAIFRLSNGLSVKLNTPSACAI